MNPDLVNRCGYNRTILTPHVYIYIYIVFYGRSDCLKRLRNRDSNSLNPVDPYRSQHDTELNLQLGLRLLHPIACHRNVKKRRRQFLQSQLPRGSLNGTVFCSFLLSYLELMCTDRQVDR